MMPKLEVLCVTMHQKDFSKVSQMNICSDVLFANQCDRTAYEEIQMDGFRARMISSQTTGVGVNRNLSLLHAEGEIVLLSDDDMRYTDDYVEKILEAFAALPDADVIIFNIHAQGQRKQKQNRRVKKLGAFSRMPYGAPRIAVRLESQKQANIWFTTLFGGGCRYTNGEDSVFLEQMRRAGLRMYVSPAVIGEVDMGESSWFRGMNEEFFFNKGAYLRCVHPKTMLLYNAYFMFRVKTKLSLKQRWKWLRKGNNAFPKGIVFRETKKD